MKRLPYFLLILFITFLCIDLNGLETVDVKSIGNDPAKGTIDKIENGTMILSVGSEKKNYKLKNLEGINFLKNDSDEDSNGFYPEYEVRLVSGDVLMGRIIRATDDDRGFIFESISFGKIPILLRWVEIIKNLANTQTGFTLDVTANSDKLDVLYFTKNNEESAEEKNADNLVGTVNAITVDGVDFTDKFEYFEDHLFEWNKINAVTLFHEEKVTMPKEFQAIASSWSGEIFTGFIGNSDGKEFNLQSPVLKVPNYTEDDEEIWKEHVDGLKVKVAEKMLNRLTFRFGNFSYLSDIQPTQSEEFPYFGGKSAIDTEKYWWKYKLDKSVTGGTIFLKNDEGKKIQYVKGIGVHSYSKLTFNLAKEYKYFMADIGIEADAGNQASVIFKVFIDDSDKPVYESPVMVESDGLKSIKVEVANADKVHLVVDFANNGDIQDRAVWGNARVLKE